MILRFQDDAGVLLEEQRGSFTLPRVGELVTLANGTCTHRVRSIRWIFDDGPTRVEITLAAATGDVP